MRQPEILGTAVGVDTAGIPVLTVYVDRDSANAGEVIRNLPRQFRGVGVKIHLTDKFRAMAKPPGGGVSHTARQTPPIQLGTSGGWTYDLANGFCCGGTLGSLVRIGNTQYILSNYHVRSRHRFGWNTESRKLVRRYPAGLIDVVHRRERAGRGHAGKEKPFPAAMSIAP
jgi:hypothetical protein